MLLLTWLGTILRLEKRTGRLTHSRLAPHRDLAADFAIDLPPEGLSGPLMGPAGITLLPAGPPGAVRLMQEGRYLFVSHRAYPDFSSAEAGHAETCLLVTDADIAVLRDLLSHDWTDEASGAPVVPRMEHGPTLHLGETKLRLATHRPQTDAGDPDRIHASGLSLRRVPNSRAARREWPIQPANRARIPDVVTEADFAASSAARLTMPAPPETAIPPLVLDTADHDFLYRRAWKSLAPAFGRIACRSQILCARNKWVLLQRRVEGMVLDETGVLNEHGYIGNFDGTEPPNFGREGDRYFLDRRLLEDAPVLTGPHAVFYGGNYQNYYHWLIDAIVPLTMMAPYLPPETTLLLPGTLADFRARPVGRLDYIEALDAFGFGAMPRAEIQGQICRVEMLFWPDHCDIQHQPAAALQEARRRALSRLPSSKGPPVRLYLRRTGMRALADEAAIEPVLRRQRIDSVQMEDLTVTQQIDLFRRAELIVAPHGAALVNILFCPPGTPVLELSPDCEYRPFFNQMAAKLGLSHAVLPCPTDDGTFNGSLAPDPKRLARLLALLLARQNRAEAA